MIPAQYSIVLILSGSKWRWSVDDEDMNAAKAGTAGDYNEACAMALAAHDALRRRDENAKP